LTARSNGGKGSDVPENMHYEPQSDIGPSGFTLASSSMSSARTIRDPVLDHLITPQNSAMIITDFQFIGNVEGQGHTHPQCRVYGST
jgi:hypothetical protein